MNRSPEPGERQCHPPEADLPEPVGPPQADRTRSITILLARVPKRSQRGVATIVRTIYKQPSPQEVLARADRVIAQLQKHFPQAVQVLTDALPDIPAFTAFPVSHWRKLWSSRPLERLNKEIRLRRACPRRECGWNLPQPGCNPPPGKRGAGRAAR